MRLKLCNSHLILPIYDLADSHVLWKGLKKNGTDPFYSAPFYLHKVTRKNQIVGNKMIYNEMVVTEVALPTLRSLKLGDP